MNYIRTGALLHWRKKSPLGGNHISTLFPTGCGGMTDRCFIHSPAKCLPLFSKQIPRTPSPFRFSVTNHLSRRANRFVIEQEQEVLRSTNYIPCVFRLYLNVTVWRLRGRSRVLLHIMLPFKVKSYTVFFFYSQSNAVACFQLTGYCSPPLSADKTVTSRNSEQHRDGLFTAL